MFRLPFCLDFFELLFVVLFLLVLSLVILVAAVVHDAADRWALGGRHLDEVEIRLAGRAQRLFGFDDPDLLVFGTDQSDRRDTNLFVAPQVA